MNIQLLAVAGAVGGVAGLLLGALIGWWYRGHKGITDKLDVELDDVAGEPGHSASLSAPDVSSSILDVLKAARHRAKEKRMAKRGYVKWFKYDGGMLRGPKWVKPETGGAGEPEYYDGDDEVTYLFPDDPMVIDGNTGARVAIHHSNQVEPVNLAEPGAPPIDGDRLDKVINLEIESDPPGFLDRLDFSPEMLLYGGIGLMLALGAAQQYLV